MTATDGADVVVSARRKGPLEDLAQRRRLGEVLEPDETVYQFGLESGIYHFSRRRPPAQIFGWPLVADRRAPARVAR